MMILNNPIYDSQTKRRRKLLFFCFELRSDVEKILSKTPSADSVEFTLVKNKLLKLTSMSINNVRKLILIGVSSIITTTLEHYTNNFKKETGIEIKEEVLKELERELLKRFAVLPYAGANFDQRISRLEKRTLIALTENFQMAIGQKLKDSQLIDKIHASFYKNASYHGGATLLGGADTLMVSEENRLYHDTALAFFKMVGVRYVRFCLTPQHNVKDICDELASYEDMVVREKVGEQVDIKGIYQIEDLPEYPHPRALYYLQPIYSLGFNPLLG